MPVEIPLANGRGVALVDEEDYEKVSKFKWCLLQGKYAIARIPGTGRSGRKIRMHRLLLPDAVEVDHIDGNGLNNTRANLRSANRQQNSWNKGPSKKIQKTSKFKGVHISHNLTNPWTAFIKAGGRNLYLGYFPTQEEAARAWDAKAREVHGEFARLNFP